MFLKYLIVVLFSFLYSQGYNVQMLGFLGYDQNTSDITGFYQDEREIAVMGLQNAAVFIDVTNPYSPYEIDRISGETTIWRDLKYWNRHVYIGNDADSNTGAVGDGIKIVSVDNIDTPTLVGTITDFDNSHNIHIDSDGYLYIVGADNHDIWIYSLDDPANPNLVGTWNFQNGETTADGYCHDIEVYNNKIYCASIYSGYFHIIDVLDKTNPYTLVTHDTGGGYISTHDCAITFDEQYLITADETEGGHIKIWDISNYNNINLVSEYFTPDWQTHTAHNIYVQENNPDMLIISYYVDGTRFVDISNPENPIEVGYYDTSEIEDLYAGNWGVYVDLPSGNIIASDIELGLYVLKFGGVSLIHDPISDRPTGDFTVIAEAYSLGYEVQNVSVQLCLDGNCDTYSMNYSMDDLYEVDISLGDNSGIVEYAIYASDTNNEQARYPDSEYIMFKYGDLEDFYLYDFEESNQGWQIGLDTDSATSGIWEWGNPNPTYWEGYYVQSGNDHTEEGVNCFVTGNSDEIDNVGYDDVDGGITTLLSPVIDLSNFNDVLLTYWRWYTNNSGNNPSTDRWYVDISNDGGETWISLENTTISNADWEMQRFILSDYIQLSNQIQLRFVAEDIFYDGNSDSGGSLVEAGIDDVLFEIISSNQECDSQGDVNEDSELNILDAVQIINIILSNPDPPYDTYCLADVNQDQIINVLDVVVLVNLILNQ